MRLSWSQLERHIKESLYLHIHVCVCVCVLKNKTKRKKKTYLPGYSKLTAPTDLWNISVSTGLGSSPQEGGPDQGGVLLPVDDPRSPRGPTLLTDLHRILRPRVGSTRPSFPGESRLLGFQEKEVFTPIITGLA